MSFTIKLYKNGAEPNRVDKTNYLIEVGTFNCTIKNEVSLTNPVIFLEGKENGDWYGGNYVYISSFGRYYFVDNIVCGITGIWELYLSVDVLHSFKEAIKNLYAFVDRSYSNYNVDIPDDKAIFEQGYHLTHQIVNNNVFKGEGSYVVSGFNFFGR